MSNETQQHNADALNEATLSKLEWGNPPNLSDLKQDMIEAQNDHANQVLKINEWLDALRVEGSAKPKKREGRSSHQPRLIRKHAEWRYSALTEAFMSTKDIFNVNPRTFEDKNSAIQNGLILNYQFNNEFNKVKFIDELVRTTVDEGTAILKAGWESKTKSVTEMVPVFEYYEDDSEEHLAVLEQIEKVFHSDPLSYSDLPEELQAAFEESQALGKPVIAKKVREEEVTTEEFVYNRPTAEICDVDSVIIDPSCEGVLSKAKFVVHRFTSCKGDLSNDPKYFNLEHIDLDTANALGQPEYSNKTEQRTFNFKDDSRTKFFVHEYWGEWDIQGDGNLTPIVVAWVGDIIVRMDLNPFPDGKLPFVVIPYLPVAKSLYGEPDAELLKDNQQISGAVTRGMIDLLGRSANAQRGMRKDALDVVNKRKFLRGEDYEFNPNIQPDAAFRMDQYPEIPSSAQYMLNLQYAEAEAVSGVKAFSGGISGDALGKVATGVRGVLDAASKRELGILRRLAAGVVELGKKFLTMNQAFLEEEKIIRITNERVVAIRREDLAGLYDLELTISTAEEDDAKASELAFMLQTTGNSMPLEITQLILSDIARLRKMPDLAKKIEEFRPEPDPMEERIKQLTVEKLEAEIEKLHSEKFKNYADAMQKEQKADNIAADTDEKAQNFVSKATGRDHQENLERISQQARSQGELKILDSQLKSDEESRKALVQSYIENLRNKRGNPDEQ